jgi:mannose-6-phosphate isomerase class I
LPSIAHTALSLSGFGGMFPGVEPIVFEPLYMQRLWGGRELETQYGRHLPDSAPYGESWEIVDREKESG